MDKITLATILHGLAFGWLLKAFANFALYYLSSRKFIDLVIGLTFFGLMAERGWSVYQNIILHDSLLLLAGQYSAIYNAGLFALLILNLLFLLFDLTFLRYKPDDDGA